MTLVLNGTNGLSDVDGSASTPAIRGTDANTGIFFPAADTIAFSEGGTEAMRIDSSGNVGIGTSSPTDTSSFTRALDLNGTSGASYYARTNSSATNYTLFGNYGSDGYINNRGSGSFIVFNNGSERMRIDSSGNLLVGITSPTARLASLGASNTSANIALYAGNSSGQDLFYARCDGYINTGTRALSPYNNTTAGSANLFVQTDGGLYRSTSSLKYKTDVHDAIHGLAEVMQLRSVTYKGKNDGDTVFGGLIAEEVHEAGLTEFVQYAEDGTPDALAYGNMVSLCIKAIQEQQALITTLTDRITALEAKP